MAYSSRVVAPSRVRELKLWKRLRYYVDDSVAPSRVRELKQRENREH